MAPVGLFGVTRSHVSAEGVNPLSGRIWRGIAFIPRRFKGIL